MVTAAAPKTNLTIRVLGNLDEIEIHLSTGDILSIMPYNDFST